MQLDESNEQEWIKEFEQKGLEAVEATLIGHLQYVGEQREAALKWVVAKHKELRDEQERLLRRNNLYALLAAIFAVLGIVVTVLLRFVF